MEATAEVTDAPVEVMVEEVVEATLEAGAGSGAVTTTSSNLQCVGGGRSPYLAAGYTAKHGEWAQMW